MFRVMKTDEEVDAVLDAAHKSRASGTKWSGMTYEDGVIATIDWLAGVAEEDPMQDE